MWTILFAVDAAAAPPPVPPRPRVVSIAPWLPVGATVRWNETLLDGVSLLVDGALRTDPDGPGPRWRLLGGVDLGNDAHRGSYVGLRAGALGTGGPPTGGVPAIRLSVTSEPVVQAVVGHKWISDHLALQVGVGLQARYPDDRDVIEPIAEARLGIAPRARRATTTAPQPTPGVDAP